MEKLKMSRVEMGKAGKLYVFILATLMLIIAIIGCMIVLSSPVPHALASSSSDAEPATSGDAGISCYVQPDSHSVLASSQKWVCRNSNDEDALWNTAATFGLQNSSASRHHPTFPFGSAIPFLFVLSVLLTKFGVDLFCRLAPRLGLVDNPDDNRKLHSVPIPVGGGSVIFCVTFLTLLVLAVLFGFSMSLPLLTFKTLFPLSVAATILVGVGLIDDKLGMSGKTKLIFQILVSTIVISFADAYSEVTAFGTTFELGHLFYPLGIIWLIGMINSVNLLDGADGVATMVGFLLTATAGIIALVQGYTMLFFVALVFSGSLLGFFLCNRPPAKVYLGDTGSMLIGLVAGILLLRACVTEGTSICIVPPLAVALIPILDSLFAIMRRINSGRSIFAADRGHIHHRLQEKFGKGYLVLGILALSILPGCLAAIVSIVFANDWIPLFVSLGVIGVAAVTGIFGREEISFLILRIVNRYKKRFDVSSYENCGEVFHFQGNGPWQSLWDDFVPSLKGMGCIKAHLDINMPFLHEDYSSEWENMELREKPEIHLMCSLPLVYEEKSIGRLNITFDSRASSPLTLLHQTCELSNLCVKYIGDYIQQKEQEAACPKLDGQRNTHLMGMGWQTGITQVENEMEYTNENEEKLSAGVS